MSTDFAKLAALPDLELHYVTRTGPSSWSACLPAVSRIVYSVEVSMTVSVEFYAKNDDEAINFFHTIPAFSGLPLARVLHNKLSSVRV